MSKFEQAAKKLIEQRFLLQEDLPAILERGKLEWKTIADSEGISIGFFEIRPVLRMRDRYPLPSWRYWSTLFFKEKLLAAIGFPRCARDCRESPCTIAPLFAI